MCGIVGGIAQRNIVPILLEGLKRLEYRGYDSAGLAVISDQTIYRKRELGKVKGLEELLRVDPVSGNIGIAHIEGFKSVRASCIRGKDIKLRI